MMELSEETLKIAIVGLGKMGLLHASILNFFPHITLAALCDRSAVTRRIFKRIFDGVDLTDDIDKLAGLGLDAVYVTTPIPSHFSIVKTLFSNKITRNVFVEKTLASNNDEAKELCRLAQGLGGVNMVGYMKRFSVTFRKANTLLDQGSIGKVVSFDAYAYSSDFSEVPKSSRTSTSRGGVLWDLGSHVVDLALWFFGDMKVSSATMESIIALGSEDSAHFRVRSSDGFDGEFNVSWCKKEYRMPESGLTIQGTKGTIMVTDDEVKLKLSEGDSRRWVRQDLNDSVAFLLGAPEYFREDQLFIQSVLNGSESAEPCFDEASKVEDILDQVRAVADRNE